MKKILCLSDRLGYRGGAERQLSGLAYFLSNNGYDVKVCTYLKQNTPSVLEINYGMNYICLDSAGGKYKKLWAVYKYIKKEKFDIIITYKDGPSIIGCILKKLGGHFKLIVSERNTTQKNDRKTKIKMWLFKSADYIVPNSYSQESFIKQNYPQIQQKTHVIINYLDKERFVPQIDRKASGDVIKCIVVASIKEQKNPLNLISALYRLKKEGVRIKVDWYGNTNNKVLYDKCCQSIDELDLSDYIQFFSAEEKIHEIYPKYDMMCLPSLYEGFPNALCEAMSCGLPVIASNVCDNPVILNNGEFGLLFDPLSPECIASAFKDILSYNREKLNAIGIECRKRITNLCAEEKFVAEYIKLIESE